MINTTFQGDFTKDEKHRFFQPGDADDRTPPFKSGERVNKRDKRGWVGILKSIEGWYGEVLWFGEKHPSRELLSDLKRAL